MAEINLLKEYPDYAPILAFWAFREWYMTRSIDFKLVVKAYKKRIDDKLLPISWIAIEDGIPVGMVSLKKNDLLSRKDLHPWLSSLFVLPEYRNHGIGNMLIDKVIERTRDFKYNILYLFTDSSNTNIENYYIKRGWEFLKEDNGNDNNIVKIFNYNL